ncbi:hypothetical protein SOVF_191400 [Spinacia oleracea]|nr:hypothetical protein SOVF_191400 [Spinacia oleracea]
MEHILRNLRGLKRENAVVSQIGKWKMRREKGNNLNWG